MTDDGAPVTRSLVGAEVVELRGEVDFANAESVRDALSGTTAPTVIVDLGAVDFVDSAGLRALDEANRTLRAAGRALALVAPPGSRAASTFRVAGFPEGGVHESVDAVVRAVPEG
jgi:anti-sigma B factor antagonist